MRNLIIIGLLFLCTSAQAQQVFFDIGRVNTSFDYKNSEGENPIDLFPGSSYSYAFGYRHNIRERIHPSAYVIFNRYINTGTDTIQDTRFEWDTRYVGLGIALDGEFYKKKRFAFYGRIAAEPQIMMRGSQTINNKIFELKDVEQFERPFLFARYGLGANYCADKNIVISLKYMRGVGTAIGSSKDLEKLALETSSVYIGLTWNMRFCRYCPAQGFY